MEKSKKEKKKEVSKKEGEDIRENSWEGVEKIKIKKKKKKKSGDRREKVGGERKKRKIKKNQKNSGGHSVPPHAHFSTFPRFKGSAGDFEWVGGAKDGKKRRGVKKK